MVKSSLRAVVLRGTATGPLCLVPLDAGAGNGLTLSAATPPDRTPLDTVARSVRAGR